MTAAGTAGAETGIAVETGCVLADCSFLKNLSVTFLMMSDPEMKKNKTPTTTAIKTNVDIQPKKRHKPFPKKKKLKIPIKMAPPPTAISGPDPF